MPDNEIVKLNHLPIHFFMNIVSANVIKIMFLSKDFENMIVYITDHIVINYLFDSLPII